MNQLSLIRVALLAIGGLTLVAGCHTEPPATKARPSLVRATVPGVVEDSARIQAKKDSLAVLASGPDTLWASNRQVFQLQEISKAQYDEASDSGQQSALPADSAAAVATEGAFMKMEGGRVWRIADTLCFRTSNARISILQDGPTYQDAVDSYEQYRYLDNLTAIQQWLVEVGQWEGRHYLLIDQQTGKQTVLISYPVISPDYQYFACANSGPTSYSLNGVQV